MSNFSVPVVRVRGIEPIPNADAIELAVVGDYRSVVKKGQFKAGDVVVYLPEASVLPDPLIETLGLVGKLAGSAKNRIKAIRLRGCLSQGILYDQVPANANEGDCVAEALGVVKYEPPIPAHMAGEVANLFGHPLKYDIENFKAFPDVLVDGEEVEMTEKTHGTFTGVAVVPGLGHPEMVAGDGIVYSKGMGAKGLVFKDNEANAGNLYMQAAKAVDLHDAIRRVFPGKTVHVLGETYGAGVQDLAYGRKDRAFAAFDIWVDGAFLGRDDFAAAVRDLGIERMPVLYRGPFSKAVMYEHTDGKSVVGAGAHIREGVVIVPVTERRDDAIGRVILKSVSGDYLTRKGEATEFN
ncbi:MAG: RNA ligase (ATP) [Desulfovibrio sp.]|uniref:RNA ligase (ATP) n=1 Tax=Desulfovibrio sp. TaxID=885 RepID=UPI00135DEB6E|nr:RNA ligase (ATP) [Desulfovibrio sp.]MTJ93611.1 RNA ligase (ATP) [Desulfovibrio sp.]